MKNDVNEAVLPAEGIPGLNASEAVLDRHLKGFQENDLDAMLDDYTDESVIITPKKIYKGIAEIRAFFEALIIDFPARYSQLILDTLVVHGDLVFIVWHARTPTIRIILGTDTLLIKDNKIHKQTFVDMVKFEN